MENRMAKYHCKLGVAPSTHKGYGDASEKTGIPRAVIADQALADWLRKRKLSINFVPRSAAASR